ncbi:tetraacyldisaccharide 4'-kinase [bacterium]|nr:tetraacyldisaccharide 4'-kinase [bacterium]
MNLSSLLAPLSLSYTAVVGIRNALYDTGVLPSHEAGVPVLSVGNLSAGGSGKTPVTLDLARRLQKDGLRVVVLSRGYGRSKPGVQMVSDGTRLLLDAAEGGDEPVMLAHALPGVPVVVAEKRVEGARFAREQLNAERIVLDDGFQHRALQRDLDIVLLDAEAPAWSWRMLPAGRLREGGPSLRRAGLIVLRGRVGSRRLQQLTAWTRRYSSAPFLHGTLRPIGLRTVEPVKDLTIQSKPLEPLSLLNRTPVAAMAGIGRPDRFFQTLQSLGVRLVYSKALPDHAALDRSAQAAWLAGASNRGAKAVVMTAKDAVKWKAKRGDLPVMVLESRWVWFDGEKVLQDILSLTLRR